MEGTAGGPVSPRILLSLTCSGSLLPSPCVLSELLVFCVLFSGVVALLLQHAFQHAPLLAFFMYSAYCMPFSSNKHINNNNLWWPASAFPKHGVTVTVMTIAGVTCHILQFFFFFLAFWHLAAAFWGSFGQAWCVLPAPFYAYVLCVPLFLSDLIVMASPFSYHLPPHVIYSSGPMGPSQHAICPLQAALRDDPLCPFAFALWSLPHRAPYTRAETWPPAALCLHLPCYLPLPLPCPTPLP